MAALVRATEEVVGMTAEIREHLLECGYCSDIVERARALERSLEHDHTEHASGARERGVDVANVAEEAQRLRRERLMGRWFLAGVSLLLFVLIMTPVLVERSAGTHEGTLFSALALAIAVLFATPVVGLMSFGRTELQGRPRLYKRLGPGREVSGVCLGLAERTGWPVLAFRLLFLALMFVKGFGFWLYLLFDLAMPIHPSDRQFLLRFRIARMWRRFLRRPSVG